MPMKRFLDDDGCDGVRHCQREVVIMMIEEES